MSLEKIQVQPKVPELVMQALITAMERGTIRMGEDLPAERELAETLGVGRGSLRECLAILEFLGAIENRGNRKAVIRDAQYIRTAISFVRSSNRGDIQEDFDEFRKINEVAIVGLACQRATEEDLEAIHKALEDMKKDPGNYRYDAEFHDALATASHNVLLAASMHLVSSMITSIRVRFLERPNYPRVAYESHLAIYEAVKDRDVARAQQEMERHLQIVRDFSKVYPTID